MLYFAYGSNMRLQQMMERCPGCSVVGPGRLDGYRFVIGGSPTVSGRGAANIVGSNNDYVLGTIYRITDRDQVELDSCEGVPVAYVKVSVQVASAGDEHECLAYVRPTQIDAEPRPGYAEKIIAGAADAGLPDDYMQKYVRPALGIS